MQAQEVASSASEHLTDSLSPDRQSRVSQRAKGPHPVRCFRDIGRHLSMWYHRVDMQRRTETVRWTSGHIRLRRRLRWCVLVMISRRRVVELPLLGPVNLNGARLWLLCFLLTLVFISAT